MKNLLIGISLSLLTAGGFYFVMINAGVPSRCGPCQSVCPLPKPDQNQNHSEAVSDECIGFDPVVTLVDIERLPVQTEEPRRLPFVTFSEPPLAPGLKPQAAGANNGVMPASFETPVKPGVEVAPQPRAKAGTGSRPLPLASPQDRF